MFFWYVFKTIKSTNIEALAIIKELEEPVIQA